MAFDPREDKSEENTPALEVVPEVEEEKGENKAGEKKTGAKKKKKSKSLYRIVLVVLVAIIIATTTYIAFLYYGVGQTSLSDVPEDQLDYYYPGEPNTIGSGYMFQPVDVRFYREKAFEKDRTIYRSKIIPIRQEETTYTNRLDQNSREPPFFGQFHLGCIKTLDDTPSSMCYKYAKDRLDEMMSFRNFRTLELREIKTYEYEIDGQSVEYYRYAAKATVGVSSSERVKGDVTAVMLIWANPGDNSYNYFIGYSIVKVESEGNLWEPDIVEDATTWDKIVSLLPRISEDN